MMVVASGKLKSIKIIYSTCSWLYAVSVHTCFNLIYMCAAELKEDLDEKENGTDEEKRTNESEEEMHTTSVKPAEQRQ